MSIKPRVRVLHLEDNPNDRELVQFALAKEGIAHEVVSAATKAEFAAALDQGEFDVIHAPTCASNYLRHYFGAKLGLILPYIVLGSLMGMTTGLADSSPLAQFKAFVASPPVIESIVCRIKLPPVDGEATPLDVGLAHSTNYTHYHAKWQPNAFFFRESPALDDLNSDKVFRQAAAVFDRNYWILENGAAPTATFWYDKKASTPNPRNPVYFVTESLQEWLSVVLNMGVHHLRPGTIQWSENKFHSKSHLRKIQVEGTLRASDKNLPLELEVTYRDTDSIATHIIRYSYGTNLGSAFIPQQIRDFFIYQKREVELGEITLLSLQTNSSPLKEQAFNSAPFITANQMRIQHYTNEMLYSLNLMGRLTPTSVSSANPASSGVITKVPLLSYAIVYGLFALALVAFAALLRLSYLRKKEGTIYPVR